MNLHRPRRSHRSLSFLLAFVLATASLTVHADEREDLEKLRATVLTLIDTLVKNRILPKDKADAMMRDAEARANVRLAQMPPPEVGTDGKKIVRVPYVPDAVKVQMRDEIKAEVLAETRGKGLGSLIAADGQSRLQIDGDLRIRAEATSLDRGNTTAQALFAATAPLSPQVTRAPDMLAQVGTGNAHNFNTQEDQGRTRIRARLGVTAKLSDTVSAGFAMATGNVTGPTSTNQTIGNNQGSGFFNKYPLLVDRAYIKFEPLPWLNMSAGRFRNPFVSTDLVWAEDLNFEGVTTTFKPNINESLSAFATAGWFPLTTQVPNQVARRSLMGAQAGIDWQIGLRDNHFKLAAAVYDFNNVEGHPEKLDLGNLGGKTPPADYGTRYEYASGYRQKGNTLFAVNDADSTKTSPLWGLASAFRELNLTTSFDYAEFDPIRIIVTGDVVYNFGFKRAEIKRRTGIDLSDGHALGYMGRLMVGVPKITRYGEWNVSVAYRYLGSDATLDAFTNSDFGLGGTNNKGTIIGASYGVANNTWISARWLSSDLIDSSMPQTSKSSFKSKFSADVFQLDLNTKF